jgi:hypothetical protein
VAGQALDVLEGIVISFVVARFFVDIDKVSINQYGGFLFLLGAGLSPVTRQ